MCEGEMDLPGSKSLEQIEQRKRQVGDAHSLCKEVTHTSTPVQCWRAVVGAPNGIVGVFVLGKNVHEQN